MAAVIPAPLAKGPRRQFKIERLLFSRFSCDIFQSRRGADSRVIRPTSKRARFPFLPRFLRVYSRHPVTYNSERVALTPNRNRLSRPRSSIASEESFPGPEPSPSIQRERIHENEKRISPFLSPFSFPPLST